MFTELKNKILFFVDKNRMKFVFWIGMFIYYDFTFAITGIENPLLWRFDIQLLYIGLGVYFSYLLSIFFDQNIFKN